MPRPLIATLSPQAFRHNLALAAAHAAGAKVWTVVKANAYGHGLLEMAAAVADVADGFALLDLAEAASLRAAGVTRPILLLEGCFGPADLAEAARMGLALVVHNAAQIAWLREARLAAPLGLFLKLNTGMNRLGFPLAQAASALQALRSSGNAGHITLMTHFADADGERGIAEQMARFAAFAAPTGLPVSVANSAAILRFPESRGDWVRPGIMLYGGLPFPGRQSAAGIGLRPVMTLRSEVIAAQQIGVGERVGYGGLFEATLPTRVGIIACGYADGYPRHAPGGTPVLVAGQRTVTLGRVSMDMIAADLSALPQAGVGSPVVLWGEGLAADEVASAAGTVSYELFCALAARVPRQLV